MSKADRSVKPSKPRGRPASANPRSERLVTLLTTEEAEAVRSAAEAIGYTVSDACREAVRAWLLEHSAVRLS